MADKGDSSHEATSKCASPTVSLPAIPSFTNSPKTEFVAVPAAQSFDFLIQRPLIEDSIGQDELNLDVCDRHAISVDPTFVGILTLDVFEAAGAGHISAGTLPGDPVSDLPIGPLIMISEGRTIRERYDDVAIVLTTVFAPLVVALVSDGGDLAVLEEPYTNALVGSDAVVLVFTDLKPSQLGFGLDALNFEDHLARQRI